MNEQPGAQDAHEIVPHETVPSDQLHRVIGGGIGAQIGGLFGAKGAKWGGFADSILGLFQGGSGAAAPSAGAAPPSAGAPPTAAAPSAAPAPAAGYGFGDISMLFGNLSKLFGSFGGGDPAAQPPAQ